jgi:hypothetical protein
VVPYEVYVEESEFLNLISWQVVEPRLVVGDEGYRLKGPRGEKRTVLANLQALNRIVMLDDRDQYELSHLWSLSSLVNCNLTKESPPPPIDAIEQSELGDLRAVVVPPRFVDFSGDSASQFANRFAFLDDF